MCQINAHLIWLIDDKELKKKNKNNTQYFLNISTVRYKSVNTLENYLTNIKTY